MHGGGIRAVNFLQCQQQSKITINLGCYFVSNPIDATRMPLKQNVDVLGIFALGLSSVASESFCSCLSAQEQLSRIFLTDTNMTIIIQSAVFDLLRLAAFRHDRPILLPT